MTEGPFEPDLLDLLNVWVEPVGVATAFACRIPGAGGGH